MFLDKNDRRKPKARWQQFECLRILILAGQYHIRSHLTTVDACIGLSAVYQRHI